MIGRLLSVFCWSFVASLLLCLVAVPGFATAFTGFIIAGGKPSESSIITLFLVTVTAILITYLVRIEAHERSIKAIPADTPASLDQIAI